MNHNILWHFLESCTGQKAPWCEWQDHLKSWAPFAGFEQRYLRLTNDRADAVKCWTDCGIGCPRDVIEYSGTDILAVCPMHEAAPYPLTKKDILAFSINQQTFHKDLCNALCIDYRGHNIEDVRGVIQLGDFIPTAGYVFPVYLIFKDDPDELSNIAVRLCLLNSRSFMLAIPTRRWLTPHLEFKLKQKQSSLIILAEEFSFDNDGKIDAIRRSDDVFEPFIASLPQPNSGGMVHFVTPHGIGWNKIQIRFVDGHTVSIKCAEKSYGRYTYSQMGMIDTRNCQPTVHWTALMDFAENRGRIDKDSSKSTPYKTFQKTKEELSKRLKEFFRLKGDPIVYDKREGCYRCRFVVFPVGDVW